MFIPKNSTNLLKAICLRQIFFILIVTLEEKDFSFQKAMGATIIFFQKPLFI